ncbi:ubiquitin carboxyl-terminal hydrolase 33-like isoform X2 [Artemia franciscana]|uniref:Ubiquitin carboxyl-terminal hydrolase n=1 Tax=Artemia franciscana TaxID=6661 RepID=A0AA88HY65_ARTSF|nr:hypothetical protein QYM36_004270 [Artemia franciscana]
MAGESRDQTVYKSFCSHVSTVESLEALQQWIIQKGAELDCKWCGTIRNNHWLCLSPGCFSIGCGDSVQDHSTAHFEQCSDHCLQLNLSSSRIWCYVCHSEVLIESNSPAPPKELRELVLTQLARNNKTNVTEESVVEEPYEEYVIEGTRKGLFGLSNLGNTCYLNAALQALLNCPELTQYFIACKGFVIGAVGTKSDGKASLARNYMQLVHHIWVDGSTKEYVAPTGVLHAIKQANPAFRGFHQHDSQELLRCFMDQMHEELKQPIRELENETPSLDISDQSEAEFETCDSGLSDVSASESDDSSVKKKKIRKSNEERERFRNYKRMRRERLNSGSEDGEFCDAVSDVPSLESDQELLSMSSESSPVRSQAPSRGESMMPLCRDLATAQLPENGDRSAPKPTRYRSIISDTFDGRIISTVQCLTCLRASSNLETFQDLSLPIPTKEQVNLIQNNMSSFQQSVSIMEKHLLQGWLYWLWSWTFGWFSGPTVSLYDCLSGFFGSDELKGDNMYSCERCKKLRNGIKKATLMELPEVLTVHLKRFRHEMNCSTKISNRVTFPLTGLNLRPYACSDSPSRVMTYDLVGVIVHHGTVGGGHYTAYALNNITKSWYEYDDNIVRQVSPETVENCQAYVLFYRKSCANTCAELASLNQVLSQMPSRKPNPGLVQFFISRQWLNKLKHFAEPGPIDNTDFLCKHGGIHPKIVPRVSELISTMTENTWEHLHSRFGGGPPCNALSECGLCRIEQEHLEIRRRRELEEYQKLAKSSSANNPTEAVMALSMNWFRHWENFVCSRTDSIPNPVDNRHIAIFKDNHYFLRRGSNHLQVSESVWKFFVEIYGGEPELRIRPATSPPKQRQRRSDEWQSLGRVSFRNSENAD